VAGAVYGCLGQAIPRAVLAECGTRPRCARSSARRSAGQPILADPVRERRHGASAVGDGLSTTAFPTNSGAGSVEAFESIAPLLVWKKEFLRDSGGAGQHRGGLGQEIEVE